MSELLNIIKSMNVPPEKLKELSEAVGSNPLAAMSILQSLNIPPETFQKLIAAVMANPEAITELGKELGVSEEKSKEIKSQVESVLNKSPK